MNKKPTISVIVPVYNAEKYLEACIKSVLSQTFDDFELILVDDGSTDGSGKICKEYAAIDDRVKVIFKKNTGVSDTRNTGLRMASGDYITFIDSDDYIDATFFETAYSSMLWNNIELYISGIVVEFFQNEEIVRCDRYEIDSEKCCDARTLLEESFISFNQILINGPWCKFYQRKLIMENHIEFNIALSLGEDMDFNLQYISCVNRIYLDHNTFYHYRRGDNDSLFSRFRKDIFKIYKQVYGKMRKVVIQKECSRITVQRLDSNCVDLWIYALSHYFKHFEKTTKLEKMQLIKEVARDPIIKNYPLYKINGKRKAIFLPLFKVHAYCLIYYLLLILARRK